MKKLLLLATLLSLSLPSQAALEKVVPRPNFPKDDCNAWAYLHFHFRYVGIQVRQLGKHLILGQRQELHALLDQYGDISHLPQEDIEKLLNRAVFKNEYELVRRLLTYKRLHQSGWLLGALLGAAKRSCEPLAVLCAKFLLVAVVARKEAADVKDTYLEDLARFTRIDQLEEGPLRNFIQFLSEQWEQSTALAAKYEAYFNFHDAIERGDEIKLQRYLPLLMNYDDDVFYDEFGESAHDKTKRLDHASAHAQLRLFHVFGKIFVMYIMEGTHEELVRAAVLVQRCPALASEYVRNERGETPLHAAVLCGNLRLVQLLIVTNPSLLDCKNKGGMTPIDYMLNGHQESLLKPLIVGASFDHVEERHEESLPLMVMPLVYLSRSISFALQAIKVY